MNNETKVLEIFVDDIIPNRFQPRLSFDDSKIVELSNSIKIHGIIQPLVLRQVADKYEIIAGERRYKAAIMAGLQKVPAIISNLDDNQSAEVALVENIQRKDLSAIEEAKSYKKLLDRGYLTQEQLSVKMGISQPSMSNKLRLLNLDETIQRALLDDKISERHARSLLSVSDFEKQKELLQRILSERLTVRQLDGEIKKMNNDQSIEQEAHIEIFDVSKNNNEIFEPSPIINNVNNQFNTEKKESSFVDLAQIAKGTTSTYVKPIELTSINNQNEIFNIPSFEETPIPRPEISPIPDVSNALDLDMPEPAVSSINSEINSLNGLNKISDIFAITNNENVSGVQNKKNLQEITIKIEKENFRTVENAFETLKEQIVAAGLKIEMDTYNIDEYYQLIIKVYK